MKTMAIGTHASPAQPAHGRPGAFGAVLRALDPGAGRAVDASSPASLLAAQAALYREVHRLEIAARILDQGVSAVKTILQTRL